MPLDFRCFSDLTVVSNSRYLACSLFFSGSRFSFNGDVALHSRVQFSFSSIARASHRQVPCIAHATLLPPSSPCCVSFPFFVAYVARLFGNIQAEEEKESSQRLNFLTVHPTYPRSYLPGFLARFLGFVHTSVVCFDPPVRSQFVSNVREMHAIGVELKLSHKLFFLSASKTPLFNRFIRSCFLSLVNCFHGMDLLVSPFVFSRCLGPSLGPTRCGATTNIRDL